MNKAKKKQQTIRQKLIAAIAMLMVSAIMVVSSSYAWFTLSTSPEVTGIETSIGANGNLEMALNNGGTINSSVGDSQKPLIEKNLTWGNLVDLSGDTYGLNMVKLLPSRLDFAGDALRQNLLQVPTYGADGRVDAMEDVIQGIYENGSVAAVDRNGVRLFGTSSGMSDEALALRTAKQNFKQYMDAAMGKAANTLTANGGNLADMAIAYGMNAGATFTRAQVESLADVVDTLESAAGDIETALKYAVKAAATTIEGGHNFSVSGSLDDVIAALELLTGTEYTALDTYVNELNELKRAIASAKSTLETAMEDGSKESFTWSEFSQAINALMNSSNITVNGLPISTIKDDPNALVNKYWEDRQILMVVSTGAGAFADIADFTGDYSTPITIPNIKYGDTINLTNVPATMKADTTLAPAYSAAISVAMESITAFEGTGNDSLSDLYAYAIDLAFRTNAADSNLLLQTDAADRIYGDNTNEATQGGGSYMEFTVATGYKLETAKRLMGCIRVVFMSTNNGSAGATAPTIYKVAVLDVANLTTTANGTVKVPLKLAQYTVVDNELKISTDANGVLFETDAVIKSLSQNVQENLTALVYLDGNIADNSMVANGEFSLSGHLNLQFASSAELKPMEYADLHIPENAGNP